MRAVSKTALSPEKMCVSNRHCIIINHSNTGQAEASEHETVLKLEKQFD